MLTVRGFVCGTPEYMAPEQARGEAVDGRTDLYAAAVILYQLITGQVPFTASSPVGVLSQHLDRPPPAPPGQAAGHPPRPRSADPARAGEGAGQPAPDRHRLPPGAGGGLLDQRPRAVGGDHPGCPRAAGAQAGGRAQARGLRRRGAAGSGGGGLLLPRGPAAGGGADGAGDRAGEVGGAAASAGAAGGGAAAAGGGAGCRRWRSCPWSSRWWRQRR
jgi:hypothetical protein